VLRAGRQDGQLVDVRAQQHVGHLGLVLQQVEQARTGRQAEDAQHRRAGDVGVDQHHRVVELGGDAHRQVDRREALALAGDRARHHDEVAVLQRRRALAHGVLDQRPLDDAVLVGHVRTRRTRRDEAGEVGSLEVDLDAARRDDRLDLGRRDGGRDLRRLRQRDRVAQDLGHGDAGLSELLEPQRGLFDQARHALKPGR
jgi:hypothetical protein